MSSIRVGRALWSGCGWCDLLAESFCGNDGPSRAVRSGGCDHRSQPSGYDPGHRHNYRSGSSPSASLTAHAILPNFSPGGNYALSITTDRNGALGKAARLRSQMSRDIMPISL